MKKVIAIIMILVVMVTMAAANAEQLKGVVYGSNYGEAHDIITKYCDDRWLIDWSINNDVDGVLYGAGALYKEGFEEEIGEELTIESFNKYSKETFDMSEIRTYKIETVDGITYYRTKAKSETTPLGWKDGIAYYCVDAIFIVFSEKEECED